MNFFQKIDEQGIKEELRKITDEDARKQCKQLVENCLVPLRTEYEDALAQLERLMTKESQRAAKYQVNMAFTTRDAYDETSEELLPMSEDDLCEEQIDTNELLMALNEQREFPLYQVYFDGSYEDLCSFMERDVIFEATAYTEFDTYHGLVRLCESNRYDHLLEELYTYFVQNGVAWKPVHTCFLKRILCVELLQLTAPQPGEKIERIEIDFRHFKEQFKFHPVPLWNIRKKQLFSSSYPFACSNSDLYEHLITADKLTKQADHLVDGNCNVFELTYTNEGDLLIRSDQRTPIAWDVIEILPDRQKELAAYQVRESSCYIPSKAFRTVAEAIYFVGKAGIEAVSLLDVSTQMPGAFREVRVYDMDSFLPDRIGRVIDAPKLYFRWKYLDEKDPWNADWLSYLYTCIKSVYPQYEIHMGE